MGGGTRTGAQSARDLGGAHAHPALRTTAFGEGGRGFSQALSGELLAAASERTRADDDDRNAVVPQRTVFARRLVLFTIIYRCIKKKKEVYIL